MKSITIAKSLALSGAPPHPRPLPPHRGGRESRIARENLPVFLASFNLIEGAGDGQNFWNGCYDLIRIGWVLIPLILIPPRPPQQHPYIMPRPALSNSPLDRGLGGYDFCISQIFNLRQLGKITITERNVAISDAELNLNFVNPALWAGNQWLGFQRGAASLWSRAGLKPREFTSLPLDFS